MRITVRYMGYGMLELKIGWVDDNTIEFSASLWYPGTGDDDATFIKDVIVLYDFQERHMEYTLSD